MWNCSKIKLSTILLIFAFSLSCDAWILKRKQKVCVIGAGAAGLTSAKHLADYSDEFDIVVFEKSSDVGGLWIYTNRTDLDEHGLPVHSAMYKNVRTNLPKELMAMPDYRQFYGETRSAVTHKTVLSYLKNYTNHFNLYQYIQFNTLVEKVTPLTGNGDWRTEKHEIETRNLDTNVTSKITCDAVMICTGNFFKPNIPKIPGIDDFSGKVIHSHDYRVPEMFTEKTVAVLGAGPSGIDISIDLSNFAKKIYLSHNYEKSASLLPSNIHQVAGVVKAVGNTLILKDGANVTADAFIFCTGYHYSYPMVNEKSGITVEDKYVHPLYRHIISIEHPSISFIGIPLRVIGFPSFYMQVQYYVTVLRGTTPLPDKKTMLEESKLPAGTSKKYAHVLGGQWAYYDELVRVSGIKPLPDYYLKGVQLWNKYFQKDKWHYKDNNLIILDNGDVKIIVPTNSTLSNH